MKQLVEQILPYERELFLWLNSCHSPFWDTFMWVYSGKLVWLPLTIVCLLVFVYKVKWQQVILFIACATLLGFLADYVSASLIKPFFERLRPSHHPDFLCCVRILNGYKGGLYGFVSNHAANGFAIATFSSLLFRYRYYTITAVVWAGLSCYSRVYLGVHFLSDVLFGALWGICVGLLVYCVYSCAGGRIRKALNDDKYSLVYSHQRAKILIASIVFTVLCIAVYSALFDFPR